MQNSFWKLAVLAAVIGFGCFGVLQVQKKLTPGQPDIELTANALEGDSSDSPFGSGEFLDDYTIRSNDDVDFGAQSEPDFDHAHSHDHHDREQQRPRPGVDFGDVASPFADTSDTSASHGHESPPPYDPNPVQRREETGQRRVTAPAASFADDHATPFDADDGPYASTSNDQVEMGSMDDAVRQADARQDTAVYDDDFVAVEGNPFLEFESTADVGRATLSSETHDHAPRHDGADTEHDEPVVGYPGAVNATVNAVVDTAKSVTDKHRPQLLFYAGDRQNREAAEVPTPAPVDVAFGSRDARSQAAAASEDNHRVRLEPEPDAFASTDRHDAFTVADDSPEFDHKQSDRAATGDHRQTVHDHDVALTAGSTFDARTDHGDLESYDDTDRMLAAAEPNQFPRFPEPQPSRERDALRDAVTDRNNSTPIPGFTARRDANIHLTQATNPPRRLDVAPLQPLQPRTTQPLPAGAGRSEFQGNGTIHRTTQQTMRPTLKIEKSAPERATIGKPMIYHILVRNTGASPARDVVIEDQIPRGTQLTGTIPRAELTDGKLVWTFDKLEPDESLDIAVRVIPKSEGEIGSIATVRFKAEVAAQTTITAPKLRFALTGPAEVKLGETVTYKYRVFNEGSGEATNVLIRNVIPEGLRHPDGNDLEYEVGDLPPGQSREVALRVVAVAPGDLVNQAVVTAEGGIIANAERPVTVIGSQLTVARRGPVRRYVGTPAIYENTISNITNRAAADATIIETIPPGMEFVEASNGGQYNAARRQVAWQIPRLDPQQIVVLRVKLKPIEGGDQRSVVQVIEQAGFESEAESLTAVHELNNMGLTLAPLADPVVAIGETMKFRIRTRNRGTAPAANVRLVLTIPPELKVQAAGPIRANSVGNRVEFTSIDSVAVDDVMDFEIMVQAIEQGDVRLQATVQSDEMQRPLTVEEAITVYDDRQ